MAIGNSFLQKQNKCLVSKGYFTSSKNQDCTMIVINKHWNVNQTVRRLDQDGAHALPQVVNTLLNKLGNNAKKTYSKYNP